MARGAVAAPICVLVAVGLNVVIGMAGLLDLGYIGFFAVGAYTVAMFGSRRRRWQAAAGRSPGRLAVAGG